MTDRVPVPDEVDVDRKRDEVVKRMLATPPQPRVKPEKKAKGE